MVSFALTAQAIADINAAAGTVMAMGFALDSGRGITGLGPPLNLVLNTFNDPVVGGGGIDFLLDDGNVTGGGDVKLNPLGIEHKLNVTALGQQREDQAFSEVRRRFMFNSASGSTLRSIFLSADLDGQLFANEGSSNVNASVQLFDTTTGDLVDEAIFFQSLGPTNYGGFANMPIDVALGFEVDLVVGRTYELISRLDLSADIFSSLGRADALFNNTFTISLSGINPTTQGGTVPEPTTLVLLGLGLAGLGFTRKRKEHS